MEAPIKTGFQLIVNRNKKSVPYFTGLKSENIGQTTQTENSLDKKPPRMKDKAT